MRCEVFPNVENELSLFFILCCFLLFSSIDIRRTTKMSFNLITVKEKDLKMATWNFTVEITTVYDLEDDN